MTLSCLMLLVFSTSIKAQNIFVKFSTGTGVSNQTATINPPFGSSYSGAAPATGAVWNVIGRAALVPQNTTAGSDYTLWSNLPLTNSDGTLGSQFLSIVYHSTVTTGTRSEPSTANGENTIQPGGVMQNAWRNFYNGSGNYLTFIVSNLPASTPYAAYIHGGTTTAGQGAGVTLDAGFGLTGSPTNGTTTNTVLNSNGSAGSLWTTNTAGGGFKLMNEKETWLALYARSDASGEISFRLNGSGSAAYLNGFQITPLVSPSLMGPTNLTVIAGSNATLTGAATGLPAPRLQWLENNTNVVAATNSSLTLLNVQYSQNDFTYSLVASNLIGVVTNTMTLTVIVTPSIANLTNQAAAAGVEVTISPTVSGVPSPVLQWQKDGTNLVGQTGSTLVVSNAQAGDAGQYCLIASNDAAGVTNCMTLTIGSDVAPIISGLTNQTVVQGNTGTFSASVSGVPVPTLQWQENSVDIPGAAGSSLILSNVQYSQNGFTYSLVASNSAGVTISNATLTVLVPPGISAQPQSLVVTNTQPAAFSVTASGVPAPTYQWTLNGSPILNATNPTFDIASAAPADMGAYAVVVSNIVSTITSSNATLTVNSTMTTVSLTPSNSATGVCYDTPLYVTFDRIPFLRNLGKISIFNVSSTNPVDTLDMSQNQVNGSFASNYQARAIGGTTFNSLTVIITSNTAAIYPHLGVLTSNQSYYVTIDNGVFTDTNGALFIGITDSNIWRFTTKPTGPVNPNNLTVAADGSGDFCTVQGAFDSLPANNTSYTLINVRDGTYTEIVNIRSKNNIALRGQSRSGTVIAYSNNGNLNASTHLENVVTVNGNDISIENLTLSDTSGFGASPAQALMLESNIKRFIFNNAAMSSFQDTMLGNTSGTQAYFNNCLIEGQTDFIWGGMNAFFTNCEIRCRLSGSHITQPRTDPGSNGMAFVNCQLTRSSNAVVGCDLGRALSYSNTSVAYINCRIDDHIIGWNSADVTNAALDLRWWEYGNSNLAATAAATYNGVALTNGDLRVMLASIATNWLNGWSPSIAPNVTAPPTNLAVNSGQPASFTVTATGIPDPTYQWRKAGTNLVGQTGSTLIIAATVADDAGTYSVIVANAAGSATNSATLTVIPTPFEAWQQAHFGCTSCPQAAAAADPDGDGLNNEAEFEAGTDPTSSASGLRIISTTAQGNDVVIIWTTAADHTNVVQATAGDGNGGYATNFADISGPIVIAGVGNVATNYTDSGGATNVPARYYRVRLSP